MNCSDCKFFTVNNSQKDMKQSYCNNEEVEKGLHGYGVSGSFYPLRISESFYCSLIKPKTLDDYFEEIKIWRNSLL